MVSSLPAMSLRDSPSTVCSALFVAAAMVWWRASASGARGSAALAHAAGAQGTTAMPRALTALLFSRRLSWILHSEFTRTCLVHRTTLFARTRTRRSSTRACSDTCVTMPDASSCWQESDQGRLDLLAGGPQGWFDSQLCLIARVSCACCAVLCSVGAAGVYGQYSGSAFAAFEAATQVVPLILQQAELGGTVRPLLSAGFLCLVLCSRLRCALRPAVLFSHCFLPCRRAWRAGASRWLRSGRCLSSWAKRLRISAS